MFYQVANIFAVNLQKSKNNESLMNLYSVDEFRQKVPLNYQNSWKVVNKNFESIRDFETSYFI